MKTVIHFARQQSSSKKAILKRISGLQKKNSGESENNGGVFNVFKMDSISALFAFFPPFVKKATLKKNVNESGLLFIRINKITNIYTILILR